MTPFKDLQEGDRIYYYKGNMTITKISCNNVSLILGCRLDDAHTISFRIKPEQLLDSTVQSPYCERTGNYYNWFESLNKAIERIGIFSDFRAYTEKKQSMLENLEKKLSEAQNDIAKLKE